MSAGPLVMRGMGWWQWVLARLRGRTRLTRRRATAVLIGATLAPITAQTLAASADDVNPSPHAIVIPGWFTKTFLDFREDIGEAVAQGKRLMVYFGQDGCPYCKRLMQVNFAHKDIVEKTRRHFNAVALNIWGDREVTWIDGTARSEKKFAAMMNVQFTPTLLFFNEKGRVVLRINGYYPPHKLRVALEYVSGRNESKVPFAEFLGEHLREPASGILHEQPFLMPHPLDLSLALRSPGKPLAVLFEQKECAACDELHRDGFSRAGIAGLVKRFNVAQVELFGNKKLVAPDGRRLTVREWGQALQVAYTPTIVFFDENGREVFRIDAYLRPFHLASGFDYVASGAYRTEPSFQRYIQRRAAAIRGSGGAVELW